MKVELTKEWCMNMAKIEERAAELHEGCGMPMEQARELAKSEATPAPNMTADDLMRLICRYTEACDDLGTGLYEQTAAETDAKHGKAVFLHGQILAEVYRLHAEAGEAHRLRESERALVAVLRDEMDEGLRLRELGGARPDEGITAMTERIVAENAQLRAQLATFTPLRAKGVVDADDNLDCWDTNPYEICTRHVWMGRQGVNMADGNITVTLQDLRGAEAKEQALWAERGRWLAEKLSERTTPDGRTVLELVEEPIWAKEDGTFADYCAAIDAAMAADEDWWASERPPTPVGWSDTDWLKHLEEIRQDQEVYHRGPLPETGWD